MATFKGGGGDGDGDGGGGAGEVEGQSIRKSHRTSSASPVSLLHQWAGPKKPSLVSVLGWAGRQGKMLSPSSTEYRNRTSR